LLEVAQSGTIRPKTFHVGAPVRRAVRRIPSVAGGYPLGSPPSLGGCRTDERSWLRPERNPGQRLQWIDREVALVSCLGNLTGTRGSHGETMAAC